METALRTLILLLIALTSRTALSQEGIISVEVYGLTYSEADCFEIAVIKEDDTFYYEILLNEDQLDGEQILIDSLSTGMYYINLISCGEPTDELYQSATSYVEVLDNEIVHVSFYMDQNITYTKIDPITLDEIIEFRREVQGEYSYFDFRWNPDGNDPKFNIGIASSGYAWFSFSKHFGFLVGGGLGWNFAQLQVDQQNSANYPDEVKSNYYNYFYASYDMKFRLSTLNQQSADLKRHNIFLDLGAVYHLPLYFKRVTRFNLKDKLVNSFIHRYSDVRLYANFGITNFQVFASYRPFDFINANLPQFPKYNVGVKFNLPY